MNIAKVRTVKKKNGFGRRRDLEHTHAVHVYC